MQVLNLGRLFFWVGFPSYALCAACIGECFHFRYLKCLVILGKWLGCPRVLESMIIDLTATNLNRINFQAMQQLACVKLVWRLHRFWRYLWD